MNNFFPYHLGTDFVQHWFNRLFMYLSPSGYGDFAADVVSKAYAPITASTTFSHRRGDIGISYAESDDICNEVIKILTPAFRKSDPRYRFEALGNLHATKMDLFRGLWEEAVPNRRASAVDGLPLDFADSVNWEKFLRNYRIACCLGLFMPGSSVWLQKARKPSWSIRDYLDVLSPKVLQEWMIFFQEFPELERAYYDLIGEIGVYFGLYDMWCQVHRFCTGAGLYDYESIPYTKRVTYSKYCSRYTHFKIYNYFSYISFLCGKALHPSVISYYKDYKGGHLFDDPVYGPPFVPFLPIGRLYIATWMARIYSGPSRYFPAFNSVKKSPLHILNQFGLSEWGSGFLNFIDFLIDYYATKLATVFMEFSIFDKFLPPGPPWSIYDTRVERLAYLVPSNANVYENVLSSYSHHGLRTKVSSCYTNVKHFLYQASFFLRNEMIRVLVNQSLNNPIELYPTSYNDCSAFWAFSAINTLVRAGLDGYRLVDYMTCNITQIYGHYDPETNNITYSCHPSYFGMGGFTEVPVVTAFFNKVKGVWCPVSLFDFINSRLRQELEFSVSLDLKAFLADMLRDAIYIYTWNEGLSCNYLKVKDAVQYLIAADMLLQGVSSYVVASYLADYLFAPTGCCTNTTLKEHFITTLGGWVSEYMNYVFQSYASLTSERDYATFNYMWPIMRVG